MDNQQEINFLTIAKRLADKYDAEIGFDLENQIINYNCDGKIAEAIAMELVEMFSRFEKQEEEKLPEHYLVID